MKKPKKCKCFTTLINCSIFLANFCNGFGFQQKSKYFSIIIVASIIHEYGYSYDKFRRHQIKLNLNREKNLHFKLLPRCIARHISKNNVWSKASSKGIDFLIMRVCGDKQNRLDCWILLTIQGQNIVHIFRLIFLSPPQKFINIYFLDTFSVSFYLQQKYSK